MEIRLFGSLEVRNATGSVDVGPPRQRTVLAALLVDAGRPVPVDTLVDRVWGQAPPDRVRHSLYIYIARLRRALGSSVRLVNRSGGYVAEVDPDTVDLHRFRRLVERARDIRRPDAQRAALLRQAMDLWRGTPLADLHGEWVARVREGWRRQHLDAAVSWAQAELRISNAAGIVSTLVDLAAEYPLAEPLVAALMRALHETGRIVAAGRASTGDAAVGRARLHRPGTRAGPARHPPGDRARATHLGGDLRHCRHSRGRQDGPGGALGAPGR